MFRDVLSFELIFISCCVCFIEYLYYDPGSEIELDPSNDWSMSMWMVIDWILISFWLGSKTYSATWSWYQSSVSMDLSATDLRSKSDIHLSKIPMVYLSQTESVIFITIKKKSCRPFSVITSHMIPLLSSSTKKQPQNQFLNLIGI